MGCNIFALLLKLGINILRHDSSTLSYRDMVLTPRSVHSLTLVTISGVSTLGFINNILTELGTLTFPAQLEIISKYFKTRVLFQLLEFYLLLSVKPFKIPFALFFF